MRYKSRKRGFVGVITIIVIALIALKYYFNLDLKTLAQNKIIQDLWSLIKQIGLLLWQVIVIILDFIRIIFDKLKNLIS
jgi:hypothetical protein